MTERWQDRAACRGKDVALFFSDDYAEERSAKAICAGCPVKGICLAEHLWEPFGVWGGQSPKQRARLRQGVRNPYGRLTTCASCVLPFYATSARNTYCSGTCRNRAVRERRIAAQATEGELAS